MKNFIKTIRQFQKSHQLQITKFFIIVSLLMNLGYFLLNFSSGLHYGSIWFITFALYYLILIIMRFTLIHDTKELNRSGRKEYLKLRKIGSFLLSLTFILAILVTLIIVQNHHLEYNGIILIIVAGYDLYLIINAVTEVFRYRKKNTPLLLANKCINLTVVLISTLSFALALIVNYTPNFLNLRAILSGGFCLTICILNALMAIYLIRYANQALLSLKTPAKPH